VIAELKRLHSPDTEDLRTWIPENDDFAILVQIMAGPAGAEGEESFDVTLCTPGWLKSRAEREGIVPGRHLLIIVEYNYDRLYKYVSEYLSSCHGDTWPEVAANIAGFGRWEFEDYQQ
jgi:hypothetical protein